MIPPFCMEGQLSQALRAETLRLLSEPGLQLKLKNLYKGRLLRASVSYHGRQGKHTKGEGSSQLESGKRLPRPEPQKGLSRPIVRYIEHLFCCWPPPTRPPQKLPLMICSSPLPRRLARAPCWSCPSGGGANKRRMSLEETKRKVSLEA
jgi:hypothetical protein